jgi:hypothetical protein
MLRDIIDRYQQAARISLINPSSPDYNARLEQKIEAKRGAKREARIEAMAQ